MPKVASLDDVGEVRHLLWVDIGSDLLGGISPQDPFDTDRLRDATNLIRRACAKSRVRGKYYISPQRLAEGAAAHCWFEVDADRDHLAQFGKPDAVAVEHCASAKRICLDRVVYKALEEMAGPPDSNPGRREMKRKQELARYMDQRW